MTIMKSLFIAITLLTLSATVALAAVPAGLVKDFEPVEGVVLLARDGEVLIDAEAIKGVRNGDLFSVIGSSEQVTHPQTGEVLGVLRQTLGLLQVIQVRPGFSITRQLAGDIPTTGAQVIRFEQVESRFFDLTADGEAFSAELRQALPQLSWSAYTQIDQAGLDSLRAKGAGYSGLLFLLDGARLEVRSSEFELLLSYEKVDLQSAEPAIPALAVVAPVVGVASAVTMPSGTAAAQGALLVGFWSGIPAKKQPVGMVVADLDADGLLEIARAFENRIEIGRLVGEQYTPLQVVKVPWRTKALSLSALDLTGNGRSELIVTIADGATLSSQIIEYRDKEYQILAKNLRWFLNVVTLPGEGPVLLGQERDKSVRGFSSKIFRLTWLDGKLNKGGEVVLPEYGTIFSLAALSESAGDKMVRINVDGRLEVYTQANEAIWVSKDKGHTETGFSQTEPSSNTGSEELDNDSYLSTPMLVLADGTILTLMNQGITTGGLFRNMSSVDVSLWSWGGIAMEKLWTQTLDGYVPAAVIADANNDGKNELAMFLSFPTNNPFSSRKSVVRLYEFK